jgi:hypothetical protein
VPAPRCADARRSATRVPEEVLPVLKKLAFAAVVAGAITALRKRSSGKVEADLWHEATSGPGSVSTPTAR